MTQSRTRFLVLEHKSQVLGFMSWQVDFEGGDVVIYWYSPSSPSNLSYELQLDESVRRMGLGAQLIRILESLGQKLGVQKVMLTVFTVNLTATTFYTRQGLHPNSSAV